MTYDIFLSYKREDEMRAAKLAKALETEGFSVWWDRSLIPAESWHDQIQSALDDAKCVVVIWTKQSAGPKGDYVRGEARQAKERGVLVPVMMQKTRLPLGFDEIQYVDLVGWRGGRGNIFFKDLVAACRAKIEGTDAPKPKGPLHRTLRRLGVGSFSVSGLIALLAVASDVASVQSHICSVKGGRHMVSDACGYLGLGDRPTRAERKAWDGRPPGECEALRRHVEAFPKGVYRSAAADMIAARRVSVEESWTPRSTKMPLFIPEGADMFATEALAQQTALSDAQRQADQTCRNFSAAARTYRYKSALPQPASWDCSDYAGGFACSFDGDVVCELEVRHETATETCGRTDP